jgi:hypothetical protein
MKSLSLIVGLFIILVTFSTPLASPQGDAQEQLGRAIQESAAASMVQDVEKGVAQEKLGLAIQNAGLSSASLAGTTDQEHLGRLIRDSAFLSYAQGEIQQEMGKTIVGLSQG